EETQEEVAWKYIPLSGPSIDETNSKNITAQLGKTAVLNCRIKYLGGKTVSWMRSRDLHLLTVGRFTYTSDDRFRSVHQPGSEDWLLKIHYAQHRDAGAYECQISTTPPMSKVVWLTVVEAVTRVLGGPDLYINSGSTINLTCVVNHSPEPPPYIFWYHESELLSYDSPWGGITVVTEHGPTSSSRLLIQRATVTDAGRYTCRPANADPHHIMVHIIPNEHPAAIHHKNGTSVGVTYTTTPTPRYPMLRTRYLKYPVQRTTPKRYPMLRPEPEVSCTKDHTQEVSYVRTRTLKYPAKGPHPRDNGAPVTSTGNPTGNGASVFYIDDPTDNGAPVTSVHYLSDTLSLMNTVSYVHCLLSSLSHMHRFSWTDEAASLFGDKVYAVSRRFHQDFYSSVSEKPAYSCRKVTPCTTTRNKEEWESLTLQVAATGHQNSVKRAATLTGHTVAQKATSDVEHQRTEAKSDVQLQQNSSTPKS
ncbi:uncharacterized protein LOC121866087, partial [Homarus americanus]|uniref:uncharacterized protein LOC121866087 n=1 Tax=Homarus americanus TaxID=6706 RepID=UPI001C46EB78